MKSYTLLFKSTMLITKKYYISLRVKISIVIQANESQSASPCRTSAELIYVSWS